MFYIERVFYIDMSVLHCLLFFPRHVMLPISAPGIVKPYINACDCQPSPAHVTGNQSVAAILAELLLPVDLYLISTRRYQYIADGFKK